MEVIILAGGLGTRLKGVVSDRPKCMAEVNGRPFLFYLLYSLEGKGIDKVVLSLGYMNEKVVSWLQERRKEFSFVIDYVIEEKPLGTGGGIKLALTKTKEDDVLILNGDTFFDIDLSSFYAFHKDKKAAISLALKPMTMFSRYGTVEVKDDRVTRFNEKQFCEKGLINGGVYLIDKTKIDLGLLPQTFSFEKDVLEKQVTKNTLYGKTFSSYFIDIGIPEDYNKAQEDFQKIF
jgi:D-glycero-alpha-D-manno-heptose 1-phosphate guanylyltransferase